VLTTALARIIDRLIVYHRADTTLLIANYPEPVRAWAAKSISFSADQVKYGTYRRNGDSLRYTARAAAAGIANVVGGIPADDLSRLARHQFVESAR